MLIAVDLDNVLNDLVEKTLELSNAKAKMDVIQALADAEKKEAEEECIPCSQKKALELNEDEIIDLLDSASYSLPKNNHYDLIIRFCFIEGIYELKDVNELLSTYDCKEFSY